MEDFIEVLSNPELENITGLSNLASVYGIILNKNISLNNLKAFENISNLEGNLAIYNCHSLKDLEGLQNITTIKGRLDIQNNEFLENIDALSKLIEVGKNCYFYNNSALTSIDGLQSLEVVGDGLLISNHANLNNLNALSNLKIITGALGIRENPLITTLDGFSNLESVQSINISKNENLIDLCGVTQIFSNYPTDFNKYWICDNGFNPSGLDLKNGLCHK